MDRPNVAYDYVLSLTVIDCGKPEGLLNGGIKYISGSDYQYLSEVQYHCNEPYYNLQGGVEGKG